MERIPSRKVEQFPKPSRKTRRFQLFSCECISHRQCCKYWHNKYPAECNRAQRPKTTEQRCRDRWDAMSSAGLIATPQLPRLIGLLQASVARTRRLAKLGMDNWLQWGIPAARARVTIACSKRRSACCSLPLAPSASSMTAPLIRGHRPLTATLPAEAAMAVVLTALIGIAAFAVLFRWKVSNPLRFVGAACLLSSPSALLQHGSVVIK
jgi:hypothetical protein